MTQRTSTYLPCKILPGQTAKAYRGETLRRATSFIVLFLRNKNSSQCSTSPSVVKVLVYYWKQTNAVKGELKQEWFFRRHVCGIMREKAYYPSFPS